MTDTYGLYLYTKSNTGVGATLVDGVDAMLVVLDATTYSTKAERIAAAEALVAAGDPTQDPPVPPVALPAGYFDQETLVTAGLPSSPTGTYPLAAAGDFLVMGRFAWQYSLASVNSGALAEVVIND